MIPHRSTPQAGNNETLDDLLNLCWKQQDCWGCLRQGPCSWCSVSSTCVPNPSAIHILAPIAHAGICPLASERWELRARCLGCDVSTITFLTCIISICSTLALVGLIAIGTRVLRRFQRWTSEHSNWWKVWTLYRPGWWRAWRFHSADSRDHDSAEQRPLLSDT